MEGQLRELEGALEREEATLRELLGCCIQAGAAKAVDDYIHSPDFEEDACDYCREIGWRDPY